MFTTPASHLEPKRMAVDYSSLSLSNGRCPSLFRLETGPLKATLATRLLATLLRARAIVTHPTMAGRPWWAVPRMICHRTTGGRQLARRECISFVQVCIHSGHLFALPSFASRCHGQCVSGKSRISTASYVANANEGRVNMMGTGADGRFYSPFRGPPPHRRRRHRVWSSWPRAGHRRRHAAPRAA